MSQVPETSPRAPVNAAVPPAPARARCPRCGHTIDTWDNFCRYCGRRTKAKVPWYYEPAWIVILALLVLGPLTLPLVWKSPKLSRPVKWIFTLFLVIYAVALVYYLWLFTVIMWRLYSTFNQDFNAF